MDTNSAITMFIMTVVVADFYNYNLHHDDGSRSTLGWSKIILDEKSGSPGSRFLDMSCEKRPEINREEHLVKNGERNCRGSRKAHLRLI